MIANSREKLLVYGAVAAVAILALNYLVWTPLSDRWSRLKADRDDAEVKIASLNDVVRRADRIEATWKQMQADGLKTSSKEAEDLVYPALQDWAQESGLGPPSSLARLRVETRDPYQRITYNAKGSGSMGVIVDFLSRIQSSKLPLRVMNLTIKPRERDGLDDLMVEVNVSTINLAPAPPTPPGKRPAGGSAR